MKLHIGSFDGMWDRGILDNNVSAIKASLITFGPVDQSRPIALSVEEIDLTAELRALLCAKESGNLNNITEVLKRIEVRLGFLSGNHRIKALQELIAEFMKKHEEVSKRHRELVVAYPNKDKRTDVTVKDLSALAALKKKLAAWLELLENWKVELFDKCKSTHSRSQQQQLTCQNCSQAQIRV